MFASIFRKPCYIHLLENKTTPHPTPPPQSSASEEGEEEYTLSLFDLLLPEKEESELAQKMESKWGPKGGSKKVIDESCNDDGLRHKNSRMCTICSKSECVLL